MSRAFNPPNPNPNPKPYYRLNSPNFSKQHDANTTKIISHQYYPYHAYDAYIQQKYHKNNQSTIPPLLLQHHNLPLTLIQFIIQLLHNFILF